jgi:hypothetical protein
MYWQIPEFANKRTYQEEAQHWSGEPETTERDDFRNVAFVRLFLSKG